MSAGHTFFRLQEMLTQHLRLSLTIWTSAPLCTPSGSGELEAELMSTFGKETPVPQHIVHPRVWVCWVIGPRLSPFWGWSVGRAVFLTSSGHPSCTAGAVSHSLGFLTLPS